MAAFLAACLIGCAGGAIGFALGRHGGHGHGWNRDDGRVRGGWDRGGWDRGPGGGFDNGPQRGERVNPPGPVAPPSIAPSTTPSAGVPAPTAGS